MEKKKSVIIKSGVGVALFAENEQKVRLANRRNVRSEFYMLIYFLH